MRFASMHVEGSPGSRWGSL